MEARPDEISTSTAAALIGVSSEMIRRVVKAGHIAVHRRGFTTVPAAVQGYAAFLREDAARAEANVAAVRAHRAKAAGQAASNARRRAGLIDRDLVEAAVAGIVAVATDRFGKLDLSGRVPSSVATRVAVEIEAALAEVRGAQMKALAVLRGEVRDDD